MLPEEMKNGINETKKDLIMDLARKDPFLKVEEIAAAINTTPRYVRTILSESGLSLMQLRKQYARNMEQRLNVTLGRANVGLTDALLGLGKHVGVNQIGVEKIINLDFAQRLQVPPEEPLLVVSRVRLVDGKPFFVNQIVTHKDLTVGADQLSSESPLRQVLGLEVAGHTSFIDRSLEVIHADTAIASSLGIPAGNPVIQSGNIIYTDGERVGIELNYFDAYRVRFVLTGEAEYSLQVIEKW
jgi:hypothetical protein